MGIEVWRRALHLLPPRTRPRWLLLLPLMLASAIAEATGAAGVFLLVRIVNEPERALRLPVFSSVASALGWTDARSILIAFALALLLFYLFKNLLALTTEYVRGICVGRSTAIVARAMLRGYLRAPYAFHFRRNSAELIRNAHESVESIFSGVMSQSVGIVTESLVVLAILTVLVVAAPSVTLAAGSLLLVVSLGFSRATRRLALRLGDSVQQRSCEALQHLQQSLHAIREIKVFGREAFFYRRFGRAEDALARARSGSQVLAILPRLVVETVFICGALLVMIILILGGGRAADSLSLLGLYAYAGFRIIPSFNRILWSTNVVRSSSRALDDVWDDFVCFGAADVPDPNTVKALPFADRLELRHVTYRYEGSDTPALNDVDLTICRGESVGIVGRTGAGKSTLLDLLVGLLEPTGGQVLIDGVAVGGNIGAWQRQIGYVPQAPYLIDGTLRENIAFGLEAEEIDEPAVQRAVAMAQLQDYVAELPAGLATVVGERGLRLSGGQRQRVAIARALYHQPQVLVFDEATSALDLETERHLSQAIRALHGVKTLILVAHRLTTVSDCDSLIFLRDGKLAGRGPLTTLLKDNSDFRAMASS